MLPVLGYPICYFSQLIQPGFTKTVPAALFTSGIVLFSGSLYVMALTGVTKLGAITPLGGLAFLAGWASLLFLLKN